MLNDIDMCYKVLADGYHFAMHAITAVCLTFFCRNFLEGKKKAWMIGMAFFLFAAVLYKVPFSMGNLFEYSVCLFVAFLVCFFLDRRNVRTKIFLFATFFVVRWVAYSLVGIVFWFSEEFIRNIIGNRINLGNMALWRYIFVKDVLTGLLNCAVNGLLLWMMLKKVSAAFVCKQEEMDTKELLVLLIPSANGIVCYEMIQIYADIYEREVGTFIFTSYPFARILWIFSHIFTLAAIISTIALYQNIKKKQDEGQARLMLKREIREIQSHITEVEKLYTEIRGVKHDLRNHISVIGSLLQQGRTDEIENYLIPLQDTVEAFDFSVKTGNPVTDVIVHEKKCEALDYGILFVSDFHYPDGSDINVFDLSIVLSNALSNAIEAAKEGGFVKISSMRNKNAYLITVVNSFHGTLVFDAENGLPKTNKQNKNAHGFGIQNMKSVAEKYYGDVMIEQKDNQVIVTVMLLADTGTPAEAALFFDRP